MSILKHALLIEDNTIAQRIPTIILNDFGTNVDIACSGEEAINTINQAQHSYDLILLDIGLPDMSGFDVAKAIRDIANLKETPIIGLTAHLDIENSCQYINETLSKPFSSTMLAHIVCQYFND